MEICFLSFLSMSTYISFQLKLKIFTIWPFTEKVCQSN